MSSYEYEQYVCHVFDSFCKKVLKNEARDIIAKYFKKSRNEVLVSSIGSDLPDALIAVDNPQIGQERFYVGKYEVLIESGEFADALHMLPEKARVIVLFAYFLDMHDTEIAKYLNMVRSTVQYQRSIPVKKMRLFIEKIMKKKAKIKYKLLPYNVIKDAVNGDPDAIERILLHYTGYMKKIIFAQVL